MPTPTPFHADYSTLIIKPLLQGFTDSIPMLTKLFISTWYLWFFIVFIFVLSIVIKIYKYQKLKKSGIFEIDKMSGEEFEERLKILFSRLGYKAKRTVNGSTKADYCADLIVEKDGIKTAVQAKRWKESVGEQVVNDIYSAIPMYDCQNGMVVTTNYFTRMAKGKAQKLKINLWNRNDLIKALLTEKFNPLVRKFIPYYSQGTQFTPPPALSSLHYALMHDVE